MAEMEDALVSEISLRKEVGVQLSLGALSNNGVMA
jgi:hypothetical protein